MTDNPICQVLEVVPTPTGYMINVWDIKNEKRYGAFSEELNLDPRHLPRVGDFVRIVPDTTEGRQKFSEFENVKNTDVSHKLKDKAPVFRGSRAAFEKKYGIRPKP